VTTVPRGTVVTECLWSLDVLLAAGLRHLGFRAWVGNQETWNPDYWYLGLGSYGLATQPAASQLASQ
jgi:hypothetical protein